MDGRRRRLLRQGLGMWAGAGALAGLGGCAAGGAPVAAAAPAGRDGRGVQPFGPLRRPVRPISRFAFGSCADQTEPQPVWEAVLATQPDLFLFGGDNVYASLQPWSAAQLAEAYAQLAAKPGFERLRRSVPHLAIWDDHDYGRNDAGAEFEHKAESKQAFLDFWGAPAHDLRREREGLYHAVTLGPPTARLQVIVLDVRWFRSPWLATDAKGARGKERYRPELHPGHTLLGDRQWRWLEAQLRQPADLRLVYSGIQVIAEGHGFERWGLFPDERQRLFDLIARTRANGVLLLSGDRHVGGLYRHTAGMPYPLYELTSSGLTHTWAEADEPDTTRIGELVKALHFGEVQVDWLRRELSLGLRDLQGQPWASLDLKLADLLPGT